MILLNFMVFLLFVVLFLILPVRAIFDVLKLKEDSNWFIELGLKLASGLILLTLFAFIIRLIRMEYWVLWVLPIFSLIYLFSGKKIKVLKSPRITLPKKIFPNVFILTIILIGVVTQNLVLFRGGWKTTDGQMFPSLHDTMWNIALATELYNHFPPQHPGMAGELLKNHHYFYPFFLAVSRYFTKTDLFDLYFRFGPILISFIFGLSLYTVASIYSKNYFFRGLSVFLGYFSGNIAYFLPFFFGSEFDWKGNTFFSDQPFDQIINPYSVLGFSLLLFSVYAIYRTTKKTNSIDDGWSLVCGLFIGALFGFKSFGGVIGVLALGLTTLFLVCLYKNLKFLLLLLPSILIFLPIFIFIVDPGQSSLVWFPGWLLTEMMSGKDKLNLTYFVQVENYYRSIHNYLGLAKIRLIELLIYFLGNFGIRILGFLYLLKLVFFDKKTTDLNIKITNVYVFFCMIIAFIIPLLFNLGSNAYNIVQFTPYALVISALFASVFTENIFLRLKNSNKTIWGVVLVVLIICLAIPVNVKNIVSKLDNPNEIIPNEEIEAFRYLKKNTNTNDVLLINPDQYSYDPMYICAFTERRVYLASPGYARQTGKNPNERMEKIESFFSDFNNVQIIYDNNIKYIYLLKPYKYQNIKEKLVKFKIYPVFENKKVIIFRTI